MTIREALNHGAAKLRATGIVSPGLDVSLLLGFVLKTDKERLILRDNETLDEATAAEYALLLERRLAGESIAYIRGRREFRGLDFWVTPDVLVPRPDTETLVEAALAVLDALNRPPHAESAGSTTSAEPTVSAVGSTMSAAVLDLCTGSGTVAIALKHERPELSLWATDISPKALAVARENAARLLDGQLLCPAGDIGETIRFLEGDLFAPLMVPPLSSSHYRHQGPRFSLITANPPYVASGTIPRLAPEVRREPWLALDGGEDGLDLIKRITMEAPDFLIPGGVLLMEADPRQMTAITLILKKKGYRNIQVYRDLSGQDRVIGAVGPK
jgi:release factor glutamine methyltransferase